MLNEWILYLLTTFEPVSSYVRLIDIISTSKCINNIFKSLKRSVSRYIDSLKVVHQFYVGSKKAFLLRRKIIVRKVEFTQTRI